MLRGSVLQIDGNAPMISVSTRILCVMECGHLIMGAVEMGQMRIKLCVIPGYVLLGNRNVRILTVVLQRPFFVMETDSVLITLMKILKHVRR